MCSRIGCTYVPRPGPAAPRYISAPNTEHTFQCSNLPASSILLPLPSSLLASLQLLSSFSPVLDRPSGCKYSRAFRLSSIANLSRSCSTRLDRRRIEERRGERSCTGIRERRVPLANYDRGFAGRLQKARARYTMNLEDSM